VRPGWHCSRPRKDLTRRSARLIAELEELTGKPVQVNMVKFDGPPEERTEVRIGPADR